MTGHERSPLTSMLRYIDPGTLNVCRLGVGVSAKKRATGTHESLTTDRLR